MDDDLVDDVDEAVTDGAGVDEPDRRRMVAVADEALTSTTPLAWNVAIPHLRDCRCGVYDGDAVEDSGRGESAQLELSPRPVDASAEADAFVRRAGQLVPAASVGAASPDAGAASPDAGAADDSAPSDFSTSAASGIDLGDRFIAGPQHVEFAAELGELVGDRRRLGLGDQGPDRRLAVRQRIGDLVTLGTVDPESLVVERSEHTAGEGPGEQRRAA